MAKTRMNNEHRNRLYRFANKHYVAPEELVQACDNAENFAYNEVNTFLHQVIMKDGDVEVLKRHNLLKETRNPPIRLNRDKRIAFNFNERFPVLKTAAVSGYRYNEILVPEGMDVWDVRLEVARKEWDEAMVPLEEHRNVYDTAIREVITKVRYVEDVIEYWPACSPEVNMLLRKQALATVVDMEKIACLQ